MTVRSGRRAGKTGSRGGPGVSSVGTAQHHACFVMALEGYKLKFWTVALAICSMRMCTPRSIVGILYSCVSYLEQVAQRVIAEALVFLPPTVGTSTH